MEQCPLTEELSRNPMAAREFAENHYRLPLWVRLMHAALAVFLK